ncbi:MAG: pseudaminic acid synthase [Gammaproteobacteria bacterium]|nr:pseudaminic acid synthase [Gammaproteobacteria bacterium]
MDFKIKNRSIGPGYPPLVIAEISANHNQSFDRALAIVKAAIEAGADAIKLQTYTADTMTIDVAGEDFQITDPSSLWAGRSLYSLYEEAHTPWEWHQKLFDYCTKHDVLAFSSPFDETAVDFLESLNVPAYKVASFEMTDLPLIRKIAATGKPMIISTGLANREEIAETVITAKQAGCESICLLHCVSAYPAKAEDYYLRTIDDLAASFNTLVGLSDHTLTNSTAVASIALGACVIEKHFTLSRADGGPDAAFSLEPAELKQLCLDVKTVWQALGEANYTLKAGEAANLKFRRSIYAVENIAKGEVFSVDNIRRIRPGFGLAPKFFEDLLGKQALVDIAKGMPIKAEYFSD